MQLPLQLLFQDFYPFFRSLGKLGEPHRQDSLCLTLLFLLKQKHLQVNRGALIKTFQICFQQGLCILGTHT